MSFILQFEQLYIELIMGVIPILIPLGSPKECKTKLIEVHQVFVLKHIYYIFSEKKIKK